MRLNIAVVTGCITIILMFWLLKNSLTSSRKGEVKAAVVGDSYTWEMNNLFLDESGKKDIKVQYFGIGGIGLSQIHKDAIYEKTVLYKPDIVVVLAGSNDLDNATDINVIKDSVPKLITNLCRDIVKLQGVYFVEPVLRTKVRRVGSVKAYEERRQLLETYLQKLGLMITFDGMKEDEMREDGIHGNRKGMERLREIMMQHVLQVRDVKQCDDWKEKHGKAMVEDNGQKK